jgi:hypothetical protein
VIPANALGRDYEQNALAACVEDVARLAGEWPVRKAIQQALIAWVLT